MLRSRIGELLKQSPIKREYIRKQLGVTHNTISNWVTGRTHPSAPQLFKLAKLLGVKVDDLYEFVEDEKE